MNHHLSNRPGRITPHARPERPVRQSTPGILFCLLALCACEKAAPPMPRVHTHTQEPEISPVKPVPAIPLPESDKNALGGPETQAEPRRVLWL